MKDNVYQMYHLLSGTTVKICFLVVSNKAKRCLLFVVVVVCMSLSNPYPSMKNVSAKIFAHRHFNNFIISISTSHWKMFQNLNGVHDLCFLLSLGMSGAPFSKVETLLGVNLHLLYFATSCCS